MSEATRRTRHVPSYRHHKPSNRAVVWIAGRDYWLGRYGSPESHEKYARLLQEWKAGGYLSPPAKSKAPADLLITELLARFWIHCQGFYRKPDGCPSGEAENFRQVLKPLKLLYGTTPARDFGPKKLKAVRERMIESGWCRSHINKQVARVKHVFKWGVSEEMIPAAVHQALSTLAGLRRGKSEAKDSAKVRPVPDDQIAAVRPHLSSVVNSIIDGRITSDDYFRIDSGFLAQPADPTYAQGDFNYDEQITSDDYFVIDSAFLGQGAPLAHRAPVAEAAATTGVAQPVVTEPLVAEPPQKESQKRTVRRVFSDELVTASRPTRRASAARRR